MRTIFDPNQVTVARLVEYLFEIIDPYSLNKQGPDVGEKYRTGIYSKSEKHLQEAKKWIKSREDAERIVVEVLPLNEFCIKRSRASGSINTLQFEEYNRNSRYQKLINATSPNYSCINTRRQKFETLVEVAGIEPASRNTSHLASTCLVLFLILV